MMIFVCVVFLFSSFELSLLLLLLLLFLLYIQLLINVKYFAYTWAPQRLLKMRANAVDVDCEFSLCEVLNCPREN